MGNIGSQTGHITQQRPPSEEQQWAHSFPRTQPRLHQHKVLPERDARQKLRHTNNGEILQSGGTLSGRHQQNRLTLDKEEKAGSAEKPAPRTYLPNQRDPLHKSGCRYTQALEYKHLQNGFSHNAFREQMKKFGSEPDLRLPLDHQETRVKGKKKYKAPPPPNLALEKAAEWDENSSSDNGPARKTRLFKTRAEMKRNYSSPVYKHKSLETERKINTKPPSDDGVQLRSHDTNFDSKLNRLSLPEMKTNNTNFHEELKEATKHLRNAKIEDHTTIEMNNKNKKEKLKTLDHNINNKDNIRLKLKQIRAVEEKKKITNNIEYTRGSCSGKESSSPEQSSPRILRETKVKEQPKTFYFGMDEPSSNDNYHTDIVDHFASNLRTINRVSKVINSSESDLSSELELDDSQTSRNGIDLQLRPILPKKQLEIPRFSPAAAWRLLSSLESNPAASTIASDDGPVFIEDRIEKYPRPPPPPTMQAGSRSNNDKSGDSGISGDAGPTGYDETPDTIMNSRNSLQMANCNRTRGISWTPQQDLGDDSSLEEGINNENPYKQQRQKFPNKPHVFSLSLPRDNHISSYMNDKNSPPYTGLQKLKRSVSGVLNNLGNKKDFTQPNLAQDQGDNWFLSKSAPNSLNNGFNSLEMKNSKNSDDNELLGQAKSAGRVMYLPEFDANQDHRHARSKTKEDVRERSKSADRSRANYKLSVFSKSCENLAADQKSSSEPEDLQDPPKINEPTQQCWRAGKKPKRFTFQSTVRQIERKRLAEKLSREAEKKEKQRLRELEAMQKVEEEFQKKRAREKANIRQQLRLFSMDDVTWSRLPPNLEIKDDIRPEPDGAVSSSTTSSPSLPLHKSPEQSPKKVYQKNKRTSNPYKHRPSSESSEDARTKAQVTQVLSEYRHPQREYKEYTGSTRYLSDFNENHAKQTTVHPQVTYNMPKAKGQNATKTSGTNYRKDFAHGVKSTRSAGSTYSEDSQSRNNSPRMYHNKYAPITRF